MTNIQLDPDGSGIIQDASLVESLNATTIGGIQTACSTNDLSGTVGTILSRLNAANLPVYTAAAQTLQADVKAGKFDLNFLNQLVVPIAPADNMNPYIYFSGSANIYINFDIMKAQGQDFFNETLAHEMKHFEYSFDNPYGFVKWKTIRTQSKLPGATFKLGDVYDKNHPSEGLGCSEKDGHEKWNPENIQVCSFGQKFQSE